MTDTIKIVLSCDDNYSKHAGVVIASILANSNEDDKLSIYILDGGISEKRKQEILSLKNIKDCDINFIKIDEHMFADYKNVKSHDYISIATYYRLKLSELLPDVKKIIYLDCDIIVKSSLKELYNTDMENYYIAGVKDIDQTNVLHNQLYINAGMLVFNLEKIREDNIEEKFLSYTKEYFNNIRLGDQTIINEVCQGHIKILHDTWNVQSADFIHRSSFIKNPNIIHMCGNDKPWMIGCLSCHKGFYYEYLQMTPWKLNGIDLFKHTFVSQIVSLFKFYKHRPVFFLQKKFWNPVIQSYKVKDDIRIFVHLHIYYLEQVDYFIKKLENLNKNNYNWDLFITMVQMNETVYDKFIKLNSKTRILIVDNRGYDVYPFIKVLNKIDLNDYDYILKLHTKNKNKNNKIGYSWRNNLVDALIESPNKIAENISIMNKNKNIGMLGSIRCLRYCSPTYNAPEDGYLYDDFCKKYNISNKHGCFIGGTMFLCRAQLMEKIKQLNFLDKDFSISKKSDDEGTLAHVIERYLGRVIEEQNYTIYPITNFKDKLKLLIKKSFSIRNDIKRTHKVITILGIKIKFKIKSR